MTTAVTNVSAYNSLFADIYERAMQVARANTVMVPLVTIYNDSIGTEVRRLSERQTATAQSVAEGTDYQSPDRMGKDAAATLTPGEVMVQAVLSDRAVRQDPTVVQDAADELGFAMAKKMDGDLLSVFGSFSGGAGVAVGSADQTLTWANILAAQQQLANGNILGRYNCVLHPYQMHDLTTEVGLMKNLASTPESVKEGLADSMWMGSFQNIDFYVSTNMTAEASDNARGAMFSSQGIALDIRVAPHGLPPEYDASARETEFNIYADYAYGIRRAAYGIDIVSDITAPT
jgi:hypothetical protein